jgi:hypothetical protein
VHARVALAACVVAILAVAESVLMTTSSPPGARAALQQAAARTASFDSGRIIFTQRSEPRAGEPGFVGRDEVRFDSGHWESISRWRLVSSEGRTVRLGAETSLEVDGGGFDRDDSRPGARFVPLGGPWGDGDFRKSSSIGSAPNTTLHTPGTGRPGSRNSIPVESVRCRLLDRDQNELAWTSTQLHARLAGAGDWSIRVRRSRRTERCAGRRSGSRPKGTRMSRCRSGAARRS